MSDDGTEWGDEELSERPFGGRPFGGKPFGGKPFGGKPFGGKPFGGKPFGGRPFGGRPFGGRPFGGRPFGGRTTEDEVGFFDSDVLSADVSELVCACSAVIRLGGKLLTSDQPLPVATFPGGPGFRAAGGAGPAPLAAVVPPQLHPGDFNLEVAVLVSSPIRRAIDENREIASTLALDLAEQLALQLDTAFLQGLAGGPPAPVPFPAPGLPAGADVLVRARHVLGAVRGAPAPQPAFRNPGWVFSAASLEALATLLTRTTLAGDAAAAARSLDSYRALWLDGTDGGTLFGYPFVISEGAGANVYFGADWQEAWIGIDPSFVAVRISTEALPAGTSGTVVRATLPLDFTVRRAGVFTGA